MEASRIPAPTSASSASSSWQAAARAAVLQSVQRLLLAHGADAAGHALAAGLVAEERGDAQHHVAQVHGVVEHHDHAGAQRGVGGARVLEREGQVELVGTDERARGAAHAARPAMRAPGRHPAGAVRCSARSGVPNGTS